jgi:DNA repair exonuclease SbcCD nuclease subunit
MKFLHTADWQLGMKAVQTGGAGEQVRSDRRWSAFWSKKTKKELEESSNSPISFGSGARI